MPDDSATVRLSVLDLSPVPPGGSFQESLRNTLSLARRAEALGYYRYWLAEHHLPDSASCAPEVMVAQVAAVTGDIRVGAGGVMLTHYAPFKVAETFALLEALYPGRIDLGVGGATGTDVETAAALRESRPPLTGQQVVQKFEDLLAFLRGGFPEGHAYSGVRIPHGGPRMPPVWLLGKSSVSAERAARLGTGFAYAHHFNPGQVADAVRTYRQQFRPTASQPRPNAILAVLVVCADTDAHADHLAHEFDLAWADAARAEEIVAANRSTMIIGSPDAVRAQLLHLAAETGVTEFLVVTQTLDHASRCKSYELLAGAFGLRAKAAAQPR